MRRQRIIQLAALVLCAALLYAGGRFMPAVNQGRTQLNAFGTEDVLKNAPPEYAFAIEAFGAFRSLIVNIAFIRAETLKQAGRYFDAMQLASWICKLQPRFPSVWNFHAWNMAWNISVTTFTPEERWNWVYNGVRLLRDEGIRFNPRAVDLYKQLGWIFNNKMGENLDDHHWNYKRAWAWRMHLVLGAPPRGTAAAAEDAQKVAGTVMDISADPLAEIARVVAARHAATRERGRQDDGRPYRTGRSLEELLAEITAEAEAWRREGVTPTDLAKRAAVQRMQAIASAPRSLGELYARHPQARAMVEALREIGVEINDAPLDEDSYWYDGKLAERFFARYRKLVDVTDVRRRILREKEESSSEVAALDRMERILGLKENDPAGQALVQFLQRKVLTEVYKLDPEHMLYVVQNFGPVDWRMVDAQSLYWVTLGLIRGGETPTKFQTDKLNTARLIHFSLRNLFQRNRMRFEPHPEDVFRSALTFMPDPDFIEAMHRSYITYGPMFDPDPGDTGGAGATFRTGHINFLTEAIQMLYFAGRLSEAERYYEYLRTHYSRREYTGELETQYTLPLRDFVMRTLYVNIENPRETHLLISGLLQRAYMELAQEDLTAYHRYVAKAFDLWNTYMKERESFRGDRVKLWPFQEYQIDAFHALLGVPGFEATTLEKVRLWRVAPNGLKQWVYDDLAEQFRQECDFWGFDVSRAFPEPLGMEEFRKEHPRRERERPEPTAETPAQAPG